MDEQPQARQHEEFEVFMAKTEVYRKNLCGKIDDLKIILGEFAVDMRSFETKLNDLPCRERRAWYDGMGKQVSFMWIVLAVFLGVCITAIVTANSSASQMSSLRTDVEQIKKVSYGYNDYERCSKSKLPEVQK